MHFQCSAEEIGVSARPVLHNLIKPGGLFLGDNLVTNRFWLWKANVEALNELRHFGIETVVRPKSVFTVFGVQFECADTEQFEGI